MEIEAEITRLQNKINGMLDILYEELPRATWLRVKKRFNEELENTRRSHSGN